MERFLFRGVPVWVLLIIFVIAMVGMVGFGTAVMERSQGHKRFGTLGALAYDIATIPDTVSKILAGKDEMRVGQDRFPGLGGWIPGTPLPGLDGYLLLSRFDNEIRRSVVDLVDLSTLKTVFTWRPAYEHLFDEHEANPDYYFNKPFRVDHFRIHQPIAFDDGDILVKDMYSPLGRFDACGNLLWSLGVVAHHANEPGLDNTVWSPGVMVPVSVEVFPPDYFDDTIMQFSADGKLLFERSMTDLLMSKGYAYLVLGMSIDWKSKDLLHVNDVQPVLTDGRYWKKGDVFVSMKNKSTVLLYRPSTDEIVWLKTGPWSFQHDVDILSDGRIGIFDNRGIQRFFGPSLWDTNRILIYDFDTDTVASPYEDAMRKADVRNTVEGLFTMLPDGRYMVEESNWGRIMFFDQAGLQLEYINRANDGNIYRFELVQVRFERGRRCAG